LGLLVLARWGLVLGSWASHRPRLAGGPPKQVVQPKQPCSALGRLEASRKDVRKLAAPIHRHRRQPRITAFCWWQEATAFVPGQLLGPLVDNGPPLAAETNSCLRSRIENLSRQLVGDSSVTSTAIRQLGQGRRYRPRRISGETASCA